MLVLDMFNVKQRHAAISQARFAMQASPQVFARLAEMPAVDIELALKLFFGKGTPAHVASDRGGVLLCRWFCPAWACQVQSWSKYCTHTERVIRIARQFSHLINSTVACLQTKTMRHIVGREGGRKAAVCHASVASGVCQAGQDAGR